MNGNEMATLHTRRSFFRNCSIGLGNIALAHLLEKEGLTAPPAISGVNPLAPKNPHFAPKAKSVIYMFMEGGPSQLDLFDPKPELEKWDGKPLPASLTKDLDLAFTKPNAAVMASRRSFQKYGRCGMEWSDWLAKTAARSDDICMIRSMHTSAFNHHPGQLLLFTGTTLAGHPSMGSWVVYGLGSESQDLPGFVVLASPEITSGAGVNVWASGFLPSSYQGTEFRKGDDPIHYLSNPPGVSEELQSVHIRALRRLNAQRYESAGDEEINSRIANYELAFRMQTAAPELVDLSTEPKSILEMYGVGKEPTHSFARHCLLARRLVERGVRFVQVVDRGWDHHSRIEEKLQERCAVTDQPTAALLKDLKQRGLLDETLVVWGGEFGRTPLVELRNSSEAGNAGRDHHPNAFSMWMAGGGIKGGQVVGKTDELCMNIVEDKIHVNDLQATILNRLGLEHTRLTYRHMGRDFRLTDVAGNVVEKLLA